MTNQAPEQNRPDEARSFAVSFTYNDRFSPASNVAAATLAILEHCQRDGCDVTGSAQAVITGLAALAAFQQGGTPRDVLERILEELIEGVVARPGAVQ